METETESKICCKCICCQISVNYFLLIMSLLFSLSVHSFDVGSDIFVLKDLYFTNTELFNACLTIMCLSFVGSSIASGLYMSKADLEKNKQFDLKSLS